MRFPLLVASAWSLASVAVLSVGCTVTPSDPAPEKQPPVQSGSISHHVGGGSSNDTDDTGNLPSECSLQFVSSDCNHCVDQQCLQVCNSLAAAPGVDQWLECVGECSTSTCVQGCDRYCPTCAKKYDRLAACIDGFCRRLCSDSPNRDNGCAFTLTDKACDECMNRACLTSCAWFAASSGAENLLACLGNCQDQACEQTCAQAYPDAAVALQSLTRCVRSRCATRCM